ncbi:hypothetical protein [Klebsiella oxytoca]|uniref:hypothetical protein n=1 Tax=Klebsiella oxytoca TaxID=571 RepID=UPI001F35E094|nr:hypothetical protein [Klebsiella oxytoca]MCE5368763.1 hypothetical protein [Klebsiella oxytoca]
MNSFLLLDDLRNTLTAGLSEWTLRTSDRGAGHDEKYRFPSIFIGQLPPRRGSQPAGVGATADSETDAPFILIRPIDGTLEGEAQADYEINIAIVCGIYSHESQTCYESGVQDVMNLCDRILETIAGKRFWADDRFKHTQPIKWMIGAPRALGPYDAGLQEAGPFFHMVCMTPFERSVNIPSNHFLIS